ncbi:Homeobox domain protein [Trichostrongylus colubriformis]|uniref:Homeobox domain protein n=1 Tax=Trichostrongylus colubriformis TaxID=6319 RepID=A0AAN8EZL5_TRICO
MMRCKCRVVFGADGTSHCFCSYSRLLTMQSIDDLEQFVAEFKKRRVALGFTQREVGSAISPASKYSQTTISRFESRALSIKNMCRMKALLSEWLSTVDDSYKKPPVASSQLELCRRKARKSRTSFGKTAQMKMEQSFAVECWPSSSTMARLADELKLNNEVVRVWFCNRRRKRNREREEAAIPLPRAAFLAGNPVSTMMNDDFSATQRSALSSCDPYPLEELSVASEFIPFQ